MPRVQLAAVLLLAGLLPLNAGALGLGEISLRSALNQPLVAEIPVTADSAEELRQLNVQLAPAATFERFGLDRAAFLDDLTFRIQNEGTRAVIRVTSSQPVSEPFVSLLLDVGWSQGRLLREYTILLDPPTFAVREGAGVAVSQPAASGPVAAPPVIRRPATPESAVAPDSDRGAASSAISGSAISGSGTYGPVRANETLWAISERLRANSDVSLNQMMVALYRANPEAFAGNINVLRRGAVLRVPGGGDLAAVSNREAAAEVQRQAEQWRGAASGPSAESAPAEAARVATPPARLQLVPPAEPVSGAPGSPGAAAGTAQGTGQGTGRAAMERELAEQQRLLSLKDSQLKSLQDRVRQLEGQAPTPPQAPVQPPEAAVPPEAATPPVAEVPVAESPAAAPAMPEDGSTAAGTADEVPAAKPRKPARRTDRASSGGFLSTLAALVFNVWFLASAAAVLLAGLFFVFARRRMAAGDEPSSRFGNDLRGDVRGGAASTQPVARRDDYSVVEATGGADRAQATVALSRPTPRDVDAETPLERTISTEGAVELDQADVVAEADFHMAYGLYDQAAELLTRALRDSPDRRDLRLKLLEVFFIWENKTAFLKEAVTFQRQLKGAADPSWSKVVIMGKQICPDEPLFAGAVSTTSDSGLDLALADDDNDKGSVDISFDDGDGDSIDLDLTGARQGPASGLLDFDLGDMDVGSSEAGSIDDTSMMQTEIASRGGSQSGTGTTEIPTVEARYVGDHSPTMETPTIESRELGVTTMETPTLESAVSGLRSVSGDLRRSGGSDQTEEINLEDLGLDLTGLDEAAGDLGTGVHESLDAASESGVYDIGTTDDDASDLLLGLAGDSTAEVRGMALDEGTLDLPAFGNALEKSAANRDRFQDATSDTAEHRAVEDTAEQPRAPTAPLGDASGELSQVDFDIGDDKALDLEPTSVMTGRRRGPEGPTMTEVGTKLDLARAYVDMGDPDGARSILNEVLEEGDSAQRQEARHLLDDLTD